jgi:hypothetical protein
MTFYTADTLVLHRASGETRWSLAVLGDCFPDPDELSAAADQLTLGYGEATFGGGASPRVKIEANAGAVRSAVVRAAAMLDAIHNLLDRTVWTASTLDDVAKIMRDGGYVIVEPNVADGIPPFVDVDKETAYGSTQRLSFVIRCF